MTTKHTSTDVTVMGRIAQVIGPVVDVEFDQAPPELYNALIIERKEGDLVLEVKQQLEGNIVRTIALSSTDGLVRGMFVKNTGAPVSVPVGKETLGRMFNVVGAPIDGNGPVKAKNSVCSSFRSDFKDQATKAEILKPVLSY